MAHIHFDEFVEIEDSDSRVQKGQLLSLLLPKGKEHLAMNAQREDDDGFDDNVNKHAQEI